MGEVIDFIKNQQTTKEEIVKALQAYKSTNLATQAEIGAKLTAQVKVYEEAVTIMGENIYDLNVENDALRNLIGNVNEKEVQDICQQKKLNNTTDDKHKIILASLHKTMTKNQGKLLNANTVPCNKQLQK